MLLPSRFTTVTEPHTGGTSTAVVAAPCTATNSSKHRPSNAVKPATRATCQSALAFAMPTSPSRSGLTIAAAGNHKASAAAVASWLIVKLPCIHAIIMLSDSVDGQHHHSAIATALTRNPHSCHCHHHPTSTCNISIASQKPACLPLLLLWQPVAFRLLLLHAAAERPIVCLQC